MSAKDLKVKDLLDIIPNLYDVEIIEWDTGTSLIHCPNWDLEITTSNKPRELHASELRKHLERQVLIIQGIEACIRIYVK